ncbi:MAG: glycosyltransferase family 2 protein [Planctomycetota bacterium]
MTSDISSHTEQMTSPHLSVVSPVYGSPMLVPVLCERLRAALAEITNDYEIILVFDCSPDDGWERISEEASKDARVKGVRLSRNFGQSSAVRAGLHYARGEWIVIMDCDLQDQPEEIPKMYARTNEGYKVIFGVRAERQDHALKRLSSYLFNKLLNFFSGSPIDGRIKYFGVYHRDVIEGVCSMKDPQHELKLLIQWVGYPSIAVPVEHAARAEGKTTYTFRKLLTLASDNIISFTNRPLYLMVGVGFCMSGVCAVVVLIYLIGYLTGKITLPGLPSTMISIWFVGGLLMMGMGVLGVYIGKIFNLAKGRPDYFVQEVTDSTPPQCR